MLSSTAEVELWGPWDWSCWIWDCCWRIMFRRRFWWGISNCGSRDHISKDSVSGLHESHSDYGPVLTYHLTLLLVFQLLVQLSQARRALMVRAVRPRCASTPR